MTSFNWKQHQHFLNTFKQYRTKIEGLSIHFLRISLPKEPSKNLVPLLMLHGFPGKLLGFLQGDSNTYEPCPFRFRFWCQTAATIRCYHSKSAWIRVFWETLQIW
ncbi:hypothetical protein COOONC_25697 [Cooperia oncophora]